MQMGFVDIATNVWSNGLLLSLLSWSRGMTCFNWLWQSMWKDKEGNGWKAETVYREEMLHRCRNVGMWMLETLRDCCVSKGTLERIIPIQLSFAARPVVGPDKNRRIVWLFTVWYKGYGTSKSMFLKFFRHFSKRQTYVDKILDH